METLMIWPVITPIPALPQTLAPQAPTILPLTTTLQAMQIITLLPTPVPVLSQTMVTP
ncbi:MAG: hypothetical protein IJN54_08075 [Lachnospiraceae bacterium]|nr:hypothetical protein [Lachnospiraceae bacterium]